MTAADYSGGGYFHYTYSAAGDRLSQQTRQGSTSYQYDAAHRLTAVNEVLLSWDDNGNLLEDHLGTQYSYDFANRLVAVSRQLSASRTTGWATG